MSRHNEAAALAGARGSSAFVHAAGASDSTARAARLLDRLEGVKALGSGRWTAKCPAHGGKSSNSLSVRTEGERTLFHCFAGCHPDDVLAAVSLRWRDLYPDRWQAAERAAVAGAGRRRPKVQTLTRVEGVDIEVERSILRIVKQQLEAGAALSIEDEARAEVALERVQAAAEVSP
jgi:hypothetical protein